MRHVLRALAWLLGAALVVGAVAVAMIVVAGREGRLYQSRVKAAFNAAALGYAPGDPERTIRAAYAGRETELSADSYPKLSYYMRERATKVYLPRALDGERIHLDICAADAADIYRLSDDSAIVVFTTGGDTMRVRIRGSGLWNDLTGAIE